MSNLSAKLLELKEFLSLDKRKTKIEEIKKELEKPNFWENKERARKLTETLARNEEIVKEYEQLQKECSDLDELEELGEDVNKEKTKLAKKIEKLEIENFFNDEESSLPAIMTIHPGAGGTESCDWALMLFRMYLRWFEKKGFKTKILNYEDGDVAGLKDAVIEVRGKHPYGWLKGESGVHRLVRISPFDAAHKRHTSFASCFVCPLIEKGIDLEIAEGDLRIDTYRAGGHGGQSVNKVSSAVRMVHLPTGIVVICQSERSQFLNKQLAMEVLKSRLYQLKKKEEEAKVAKLSGEKYEIGWGREIRSYIFCPYTMVKDHRTGMETSQLQAIMDGEIDDFVRAYLLKKKT